LPEVKKKGIGVSTVLGKMPKLITPELRPLALEIKKPFTMKIAHAKKRR